MKQENTNEILDAMKDAELILVGLGEEFDCVRDYAMSKVYENGRNALMQSKQSALVPAWQNLFRKDGAGAVASGLKSLAHVLEDKNYFVVSVSTNNEIVQVPWREGRLVMPCGTDLYRQCSQECKNNLLLLNETERSSLETALIKWRNALDQRENADLPEGLGVCECCGKTVELNNIYSENYDERGYLSAWQLYTKWLQGTVNKKVVILELGVGMKFPSVIRFPFEKVAYFNQKAKFYRINKNLYHLTEELAGKGFGIADNAIDWLQNLC